MDDPIRPVAWAIAQAWWSKTHSQPDAPASDATSSADYADGFWQSFVGEAKAAVAAVTAIETAAHPARRVASDRFA